MVRYFSRYMYMTILSAISNVPDRCKFVKILKASKIDGMRPLIENVQQNIAPPATLIRIFFFEEITIHL